jgi:phosphoglycolate phosphatase-like HAD superfamily hydrolase
MNSAVRTPRLAEWLRPARAIVLDFDGTLVDSTPIKQRAFERCFAGFAESRHEILAYCWGHHHTPRGEKFRYVYERILRRPYTAKIAASLHAQFDAETTQQIIEAPERPGAARFLAATAKRHLTALLSSTPHEILEAIVSQRGWRPWFTRIQGAPVHKASWLRSLKTQHALTPQELVFFGDTDEDAQAAKAADCAFVGVGTHLEGRVTCWIEDFMRTSDLGVEG